MDPFTASVFVVWAGKTCSFHEMKHYDMLRKRLLSHAMHNMTMTEKRAKGIHSVRSSCCVKRLLHHTGNIFHVTWLYPGDIEEYTGWNSLPCKCLSYYQVTTAFLMPHTRVSFVITSMTSSFSNLPVVSNHSLSWLYILKVVLILFLLSIFTFPEKVIHMNWVLQWHCDWKKNDSKQWKEVQ